ncbi:MAG: HlyD family efflux transporter periplasmic adaptor subunit [Kiritimatiellae bacterium]|nr:HlyD family efflux transporter periplasmic adaptor subunit [Kiritimatiellia bacterium]
MKAKFCALVLAALPAMVAAEETAVRGELFCSVERGLALPYGGVIAEWSVEVGRDVRRGEPLVKYTLSAKARTELESMISPVPPAAAEAEVAALEAERAEARAAAEEAERLAGEQLGTRQQAELAKGRERALEKRLVAARERAGFERRQRETRLQWLRETFGIEQPEQGIPETVILPAPMDGTVIWIAGDARPGAEGEPGKPVATLGVMDPMIVRAHVHELDVVRLQVGDRARMTLLARPGLELEGTVSRIAWAPFPHWLPEPSYFEVELSVPNPDRALRKGYKVNLEFGGAPAKE